MVRRRKQVVRDQVRSKFSQILQYLVDATPGALGAALVDGDGETVDYAGSLAPFDIKVAGAHFQLELRKSSDILSHAFGPVGQLVVRARSGSYVARPLLDGYVLVVVMGRCAGFGISERAINQAEFELRAEGGWIPPPGFEHWMHVRVKVNHTDRLRPERVEVKSVWHEVQVIGSVVGLQRAERGYRVRIESGVELTLVRERLGRWYADMRAD